MDSRRLGSILWGLVAVAGAVTAPGARHLACRPPHDRFAFCNTSLPLAARVDDLIRRIPPEAKPNLLTARGKGGSGSQMEALPELGVPAYYWGTNCLHATG